MNFKRILIPIVNLAIFVGAGALLYHFATNSSTGTSGESEDENQGIATAVPVHIAPVVRTTLHQILTVYGRVEPAPASNEGSAAEARITLPIGSLIAEVYCREGDHVEKGQLLLVLDTRLADAEIKRAQMIVAGSRKFTDAVTALKGGPSWLPMMAGWATNAAQAKLAYADAQRQLQNITAPIAGTVAAVTVHPGEVAGALTPDLDLIDLDHLVLALDVPGEFASDVKVGQPATFAAEFTASPFQSLPGAQPDTMPSVVESKVIRIDPTIDAMTGTTSADVLIPPHSDFRPGQFRVARIEIQTDADCLAVPAESIVPDELSRPRVAVVGEHKDQADFRYVHLGIREGDMVELTGDDIEPGQMIVTTGAYGLLNRSGIIVVGR